MLRNILIRFLRFGFRVWPFMHGRGWILRAAKLLLGSGPVRFDIGAERSTLPFFAVRDGNTGASSLARHHEASVEMHVNVVPLDDLVDRADFLKADVEGAEILVFRGATRLLSSDDAPIVFFEVVDRFCSDFGITAAGVKQFLIDRGYGIYRWNGRRFTSVDVNERHEQEDLFALKPRHIARMARP